MLRDSDDSRGQEQPGRDSSSGDLIDRLICERTTTGVIRDELEAALESDREGFLDRVTALVSRESALLVAARRLTDCRSLDELLPRMVAVVTELLDTERCTIFVHDEATDELYTRASIDEAMTEIRFPSDRGLAGASFKSGEVLIVSDVYGDVRFNPAIDRATGFETRNALCVPIRLGAENDGEVVGVAEAINKRAGEFGREDVSFLTALSAQAGVAFVNARLHAEIARARDDEVAFFEVTSSIATELQLIPLIRNFMETIGAIFEAERATLFMYDAETNELWVPVSQDPELVGMRFPPTLGIAGAVFTSGKTINIPDAYADPRFNRKVDEATNFRTRDILCMPVVNKDGQVIAVTEVLNRKSGLVSWIDERRLGVFSAQAAIAIENAQLFGEIIRMKNYSESILNGITSGVITIDDHSTVLKMNSAAERLFVLDSLEVDVIGKNIDALFKGKNDWIAQAVRGVSATGKPHIAVEAELSLAESHQQDPRRRSSATMNLSIVPLQADEGSSSGCIVMIEDITREKRLKSTMARYMSSAIAEQLVEQGEAALGGKMQKASILFTDIRNFTNFSERIGPQATVQLLNEYFSIMVDVIFENEGILDKYIGDSIMAVFGAPFTRPDDADRAVQTGIEMLRALRILNARRKSAGDDPIRMSIGVNSDVVLTGNIGSVRRMDYTVIGDGVNLASRLEGASKQYGTELLVSELTVRELTRDHLVREIDRVRVKGKSLPVGIFEVIDPQSDDIGQFMDALGPYTAALEQYHEREWEPAMRLFDAALEIRPADLVSRMYAGRCRTFINAPPPADWDSVWVMTEK